MPKKLLVTFFATSGNLLRQAVDEKCWVIASSVNEHSLNNFYKANNPASQ